MILNDNNDGKVINTVKIPWNLIVFFVLRLLLEGLSRECAIKMAMEEFGGHFSETDILERMF